MIKTVAVGLWSCAVALGAAYLGTAWHDREVAPARQQQTTTLIKLKPISLPIVRQGKLEGYTLAQFSFLAEPETLKKLAVKPDAFLVDALYKGLYSQAESDLSRLGREDWTGLAKIAKDTVNARYNSEVLVDVLLDDFGFVPVGSARKDISPVPNGKKGEKRASAD